MVQIIPLSEVDACSAYSNLEVLLYEFIGKWIPFYAVISWIISNNNLDQNIKGRQDIKIYIIK